MCWVTENSNSFYIPQVVLLEMPGLVVTVIDQKALTGPLPGTLL
jgi:hypothetical protein